MCRKRDHRAGEYHEKFKIRPIHRLGKDTCGDYDRRHSKFRRTATRRAGSSSDEDVQASLGPHALSKSLVPAPRPCRAPRSSTRPAGVRGGRKGSGHYHQQLSSISGSLASVVRRRATPLARQAISPARLRSTCVPLPQFSEEQQQRRRNEAWALSNQCQNLIDRLNELKHNQ
jgi:hypothetical protein